MNSYNSTWKDLLAKKIDYTQTTASNSELLPIIKGKISILIDQLSLVKNDDENKSIFNTWLEPLVIKFAFHSLSTLSIFEGVNLRRNNSKNDLLIFDESSAIVLFRTTLENYLTSYYLFFQKIDNSEKLFRQTIWRYSGISQKLNFKDYKPSKDELHDHEGMQNLIKKNEHFLKCHVNDQKYILKGHKSRLLSWGKIIEYSDLNPDLFSEFYSYQSSYAHSEFHSISQFYSGNYGHFKNNIRSKHILILLEGLISKLIIDLNEYFQSIKFSGIEKELIFELYFLALPISKNNSQKFEQLMSCNYSGQ
jgi:hypothetical protein